MKKIKKRTNKPWLPIGTLLEDKEYPVETGMIVDIDKDRPDPYKVYVLDYNNCDWLEKDYIEEGCTVLKV